MIGLMMGVATAQEPISLPVAVIVPFAIAGGTGAAKASADTCPAGTTVPVDETVTAEVQAGVVQAMTNELKTKLSETMKVHVLEAGEVPAAGTVVFAGCVVKMMAGSKGKRLIGMGGTSYVGVHAEVSTGQKFDVEEKGKNVLPGLGAALIINASRSHHTSLDGDAERAADEVVKQYLKSKGK